MYYYNGAWLEDAGHWGTTFKVHILPAAGPFLSIIFLLPVCLPGGEQFCAIMFSWQ